MNIHNLNNMKLKNIDREITIGNKTRKIAREINNALLDGVIVKDMTMGNVDFPATNIDKANEVAVRLLCGLSQGELDNIDEEEYQNILVEINKKK